MAPGSKPHKEHSQNKGLEDVVSLPHCPLDVTSSGEFCFPGRCWGGPPQLSGVPCTAPCPARTGLCMPDFALPKSWAVGADLLGWGRAAAANPNHCLQELGRFQPEIQPQPAPLIIPCPLESCLEELSRLQLAQAPASCLAAISPVGCFVTCPRKGDLWGLWGRPEFLWLGSHCLTLLPEPRGGGMRLDEKQGLGHWSWAAP